MLYDIDSSSQSLDNHDFLGEFECTLAQLVSSRTVQKPLVNKNYTGDNGSIILITEELSSCKEELVVQFVGKSLENRSWFCSLNPFLEFFKANEDGTFTVVHRTEQVRSTKDPVWREFSVPLRTFCSGDYERNLKVNVRDFKSAGNHKLIGTFYTTVRKLSEGPGASNNYWVINDERKVSLQNM